MADIVEKGNRDGRSGDDSQSRDIYIYQRWKKIGNNFHTCKNI